jgi:hypothetical protein
MVQRKYFPIESALMVNQILLQNLERLVAKQLAKI